MTGAGAVSTSGRPERRPPPNTCQHSVLSSGSARVVDVAVIAVRATATPEPTAAEQGRPAAHRRYGGYFDLQLSRLLGARVEADLSQPWHRPGPVYGDPRLAPYRLGQRAFQAVVLDAYKRRCAITGGRIRPVLQAAHIRPLPAGDEHRLDQSTIPVRRRSMAGRRTGPTSPSCRRVRWHCDGSRRER
ncbi:hypothetical protein [Plantactinospora sp. GCM10030261]|uniref:hypothetical protein n=1 Tax=Plantactinospora sp. GCM10030261 TaxID=3273420 RepID=UPI003621FEA1